MPIVFVHGVNNRLGPSYDARSKVTAKFVAKHLANAPIGGLALPADPQVSFPYWGDLATTFAWNMGSLPRAEIEALGGSAELDLQPALGHVRDAFPQLPAEPLTALAKERLSLAVDVLSDLALRGATAGQEQAAADFVVAASAYAEQHPHPPWVAAIANDSQFVSRLAAELQAAEAGDGVQALGGFGSMIGKMQAAGLKLKQAVGKMAGGALDHAGDFASTKFLAASRDALNANLGRFFGDVFIYFNTRGDHATPGEIPQRIIKAFDAARAAAPNEPLVVIGHSLGGVISFDVLGHFRPDIEVDLFISVGSQVGHFEELKLYRTSDPAIKMPAKAPTPPNIKRWINVFDRVDIFSYSIEKIFDRFNVDASYDTQTYMVKSHGVYFEQERFWQRLRARFGDLT